MNKTPHNIKTGIKQAITLVAVWLVTVNAHAASNITVTAGTLTLTLPPGNNTFGTLTVNGSANLTLVGSVDSTNSFTSVTPSTAGGSLTLTNLVMNSAGAVALGATAGNNNNTISVSGTNSLWSLGGILAIGNAITATGNVVNISNSGGVSVTGEMKMVGSGGQLNITSGGKLYGTGAGNVGRNVAGANSNTVTVTDSGSLWSLGANDLYIGSAITVIGSVVNISNNGVVSNRTVYMYALGGQLNITSGGKLMSSGASHLGYANGVNSNTVTVTGANSLWNLGANDLTIGRVLGATGNVVNVYNNGVISNANLNMYGFGGQLNITSGGQIISTGAGNMGNIAGCNSNAVIVTGANSSWRLGNSTLTIGNVASQVGNGVLLTGGGLLEVAGIALGHASSSGNTLTNAGGIVQFTTAAPTITFAAGTGNAIVMNSGTLSYRGLAVTGRVNLTNNWTKAGTGIGTNNIVWQGSNTFRLDSSAGTNSLGRSYLFDTNLGSTNYVGLELLGTSALYGSGVTVGANGSLLASNATAVIYGAFTNNGAMTLANSTLTYTNGCTLADGTLNWNDTNSLVVVNGTLSLSGTQTLNLANVPKTALPLTLFRATSIPDAGSWNVTASGYVVKNNGTSLTLNKNTGTLIRFF